jgi:hypothetical protein
VRGDGAERGLALAQGAFYAATGAWPVVHLASFEAVTGPKLEGWLVRTTGVVVGVIGAALLSAGARRAVTPELVLLGASAAAGLAAIDVWYAGVRRRIAPVYLADAAVELAIAGAWAVIAARGRSRAAAEGGAR